MLPVRLLRNSGKIDQPRETRALLRHIFRPAAEETNA